MLAVRAASSTAQIRKSHNPSTVWSLKYVLTPKSKPAGSRPSSARWRRMMAQASHALAVQVSSPINSKNSPLSCTLLPVLRTENQLAIRSRVLSRRIFARSRLERNGSRVIWLSGGRTLPIHNPSSRLAAARW